MEEAIRYALSGHRFCCEHLLHFDSCASDKL